MPLAQVLFPPPTEQGWTEWAFQHYQDHVALIAAIKRDTGANLPLYEIYPINPNDTTTWLEQHARQHADMLAVYGIIGSDLSTVDFENKRQKDAWLWLNFTEHRSVRDATGLTF